MANFLIKDPTTTFFDQSFIQAKMAYQTAIKNLKKQKKPIGELFNFYADQLKIADKILSNPLETTAVRYAQAEVQDTFKKLCEHDLATSSPLSPDVGEEAET